MPTVAREIDALGGSDFEREKLADSLRRRAQSSNDECRIDDAQLFTEAADRLDRDDYNLALTAALDIAENADALIEELLECVANALSGGVGLEHWVKDARTLVQHASWRRAL